MKTVKRQKRIVHIKLPPRAKGKRFKLSQLNSIKWEDIPFSLPTPQYLEALKRLVDQSLMLDVLCRALEKANKQYETEKILGTDFHEWWLEERDAAEALRQERREWANFMRDIQLVQAAGADTLCGSKWINAQGLNEAIKRYTDGDSQAVHTPGGYAK